MFDSEGRGIAILDIPFPLALFKLFLPETECVTSLPDVERRFLLLAT
jgi:hypothetical protein